MSSVSSAENGSDHLCSKDEFNNCGWTMIPAKGKAISVTGDKPQDLLFLIEKFSSIWHGHFRFGGIGLLKVDGLNDSEVWAVGPERPGPERPGPERNI